MEEFGGNCHGSQTIHSTYNDTNGSTNGATHLVYYFITLPTELYMTLGQLGFLLLPGQYNITLFLYPIVGIRLYVRLSIRLSVGQFCTTLNRFYKKKRRMENFVQYK